MQSQTMKAVIIPTYAQAEDLVKGDIETQYYDIIYFKQTDGIVSYYDMRSNISLEDLESFMAEMDAENMVAELHMWLTPEDSSHAIAELRKKAKMASDAAKKRAAMEAARAEREDAIAAEAKASDAAKAMREAEEKLLENP